MQIKIKINAKWFVKVEEPSIENPNGYIFEYGKENQSLVVRTHTVIVESFQLSTVQTYDFLTKHIESVTILNDEKKEITKYKCEEVS